MAGCRAETRPSEGSIRLTRIGAATSNTGPSASSGATGRLTRQTAAVNEAEPIPSPDPAGLVQTSSTVALLRLYGAILDELGRREVVRSRNAPAGDFAEYLAARVYRGQLGRRSEKSWDVRAGDGRLVQVKCRMVGAKRSGNYSFFRSWDFDVCVFVRLDSTTYEVVSAVEVPKSGVQSLAQTTAHVNGSRIQLAHNLLQVPGAVDRTKDFQLMFEATE